jgi:hypothetical protein
MTVIKGLLAAALMAAALGAQANDGPYNEQANAQADVQQALHAAQANHHNGCWYSVPTGAATAALWIRLCTAAARC